ncbi:uncharacterized protein I303_107571 [Kwoniella dejecticola CBS 10117]|uniref:AB hydrolase-1 domain-containing protein n=1 Tax=Kwoniella dejecticola CBS 10117 TaxID=1296121 RepID=A0A1A5ZV36_9TREE|nr:uncharacterized protein I303_07581 [Kwoniella dejecticola CBS 10117]OBR81671.1 hypothetical protein I303_07581 [Kwoniella dejecticola CBS 10117]
MSAATKTIAGTYHHAEHLEFPYVLPHRSVNDVAATSVVLIHGAFASHHEYSGVIESKILSKYHLILPDLHSDGLDISKGIDPFEISRVASLVSHLIRQRAKGGKAHLVGVSLGAHVVVATAAHAPDVIHGHSIFISGYNRFQPPPPVKLVAPYIFYGMSKLEDVLFKSNRTKSGETNDGSQAPSGICTMKLVREIGGAVFGHSNSGERLIGPTGIEARTCVVVATHFLSGDRIIHAQRLLEKMRGAEGEDRVHVLVQNKSMKHPWHVFEPELFATAVQAWIEGRGLREGFVPC